MSQKRVFIIHGYNANVRKHWFEAFKQRLDKMGIATHIVPLPDSANPSVKKWLHALKEAIEFIDENTYIIGHSLGSLTTLLFLNTFDEGQKLGGVLLVSGFYEPLPNLALLDEFTQIPLDFAKLEKLIEQREVISARDDEIVPTNLSHNLALKLGANFTQLQRGGHFMQEDGFKDFKRGFGILKAMIKDEF